jgi:hypothetical protein
MRRQTYRRESYRRRRPDDPQVLLRERKPQTYGLRTTALPRQSALAIHHQPTGSAQSKAPLTAGSSFWFGLSGAAGS